MIALTTPHSSQWAGLIAASGHDERDATTIRELLGENATLLVLQAGDLPFDTIRELISRRIVNVLAVTDSEGLTRLEPVLTKASTLASFRRLVVLHDETCEGLNELISRGVLLLRDCPEVRAALTHSGCGMDGVLRSPLELPRTLPLAATSGHVA